MSNETYAKVLSASRKRARELTGTGRKILEVSQASGRDFLPYYGNSLGDPKLLEQADVTSATSGVLNKLFGGRSVYSQLNQFSNTWAAIPRSQRTRSSPYGWRAKTAFADSGKGGQTEGTVPSAVVSTYFEVAPTIKEHSTQMRVSGLQQDLVEIDDAYAALADLQGELGVEHAKQIERALHTDIDTLASVNMESVDRVTASSTNQAAIGWTVGDEDIYGIDRSAQTWANAVQSASATARALTKQLIKDQLRTVFANGGDTSFILTGHASWQAITDLYEPAARYDMSAGMLQGAKVGEADRMEGGSVNPLLGEIYGRPIVGTDQAVTDSNELPRIYGLDVSNPDGQDKPRLGFDLVRPTQVFTAGERSSGAPQSISFLGDSVLATTRAEIGCRFFKAQWQLRDITAP